MTESLTKFKAEMEKRGLFRQLQVAVNLIPPPPPDCSPDELIDRHRAAAKHALIMYAKRHESFREMMFEAAMDHLMDTILTDDLVTPDEGFTPTAEERAMAKVGLLHALATVFRNFH